METIHLDEFLEGGILREESFRSSIAHIDWSRYRGKRVLIRGCTDVPVPTWAYLVIAARLVQVADHVLYGEPCSFVKIFDRNGQKKPAP
ncbi:MAG: DUF2480 family protein [Fidelibacterota bacterium]